VTVFGQRKEKIQKRKEIESEDKGGGGADETFMSGRTPI